MKLFPIKKILILVTILALPGFLYYQLKEKGKNRYKPLPFFGPKVVAGTFHSVHGDRIPDTLYTQGNSYGVNFANKAIKAFEANYGSNPVLRFVGLSIDPKNDTPEVLKSYADGLGAKVGKWDMLTGDSAQVYSLINKQLFVDALQKQENGKTKFIYSNLFVLLDTKHRIRGYYEATSQEALSKLDDEIKVLILEELRNNTDGR
jgi:protein SCO1/2